MPHPPLHLILYGRIYIYTHTHTCVCVCVCMCLITDVLALALPCFTCFTFLVYLLYYSRNDSWQSTDVLLTRFTSSYEMHSGAPLAMDQKIYTYTYILYAYIYIRTICMYMQWKRARNDSWQSTDALYKTHV
jgi:hypothetical protein